jgi:hypothetical protein
LTEETKAVVAINELRRRMMQVAVKNPRGRSDHEDVSRKRYISRLLKRLLIQGIKYCEAFGRRLE